jgi:transposase
MSPNPKPRRKLRKHTREFKISAVKLVHEQGYTFVDAAKSLGVDPSSVRGWSKAFAAEAGVVPTGEGAVQAELRRLRKENARLTMERDILKKATAFFARELS